MVSIKAKTVGASPFLVLVSFLCAQVYVFALYCLFHSKGRCIHEVTLFFNTKNFFMNNNY